MRLIDADELVKLLKANTMSNGTLINTNTMIAVVEKMPTAYDIENVVAELETRRTEYEFHSENASNDETKYYRRGIMRGYEYSKELVMRGGIDELRSN